MGMRATVSGAKIKMDGLLAKVVVEIAQSWPQYWLGVKVVEYGGVPCISGGVVTLSRQNVRDAVIQMRDIFVYGDQTCNYNEWTMGGSSLTHIQDILAFKADVDTFALLADWLANTDEQEIHFA